MPRTPPKKPRKQKDATVHVGATPTQARAWRAAAEADKRSLSQWAAIALDEKAAAAANSKREGSHDR